MVTQYTSINNSSRGGEGVVTFVPNGKGSGTNLKERGEERRGEGGGRGGVERVRGEGGGGGIFQS